MSSLALLASEVVAERYEAANDPVPMPHRLLLKAGAVGALELMDEVLKKIAEKDAALAEAAAACICEEILILNKKAGR